MTVAGCTLVGKLETIKGEGALNPVTSPPDLLS
jgi:hypothetical protein